jgi:hypothetical protein
MGVCPLQEIDAIAEILVPQHGLIIPDRLFFAAKQTACVDLRPAGWLISWLRPAGIYPYSFKLDLVK